MAALLLNPLRAKPCCEDRQTSDCCMLLAASEVRSEKPIDSLERVAEITRKSCDGHPAPK